MQLLLAFTGSIYSFIYSFTPILFCIHGMPASPTTATAYRYYIFDTYMISGHERHRSLRCMSMNQLRVSDGTLIKHLIERDVTSGLLLYVLKLSAQGTVTFSHEI